MSAGSRDLAVLAGALRTYGARDLRLQMLRGLRAGGKPMVEQARRNAVERLPRSGGLNELTAQEKITVRVRTGARTAGVQVRTADRLLNQTNEGYVRHPTFGRTGKGQWSTTQTPAAKGWWDDAAESAAPRARAEMFAVVEEVAVAIVERVRLGGLDRAGLGRL